MLYVPGCEEGVPARLDRRKLRTAGQDRRAPTTRMRLKLRGDRFGVPSVPTIGLGLASAGSDRPVRLGSIPLGVSRPKAEPRACIDSGPSRRIRAQSKRVEC